MRLVDYIAQTPEENLAMDEVLLISAEKGEIGETVRFWESEEYFVVVGRAGKIDQECLVNECKSENISLFRRISGGGTVLQGKGCLNYSFVLDYDTDKAYEQINSSYKRILSGISGNMIKNGINPQFFPISDLAFDDKKFSGNAQARKKKFFLHHGTILYDFDLEKIKKFLKYPPKEPEYRKNREHSDFVTNLPMKKNDIITAVLDIFPAYPENWHPDKKIIEKAEKLSQEKYNSDEWNLMF